MTFHSIQTKAITPKDIQTLRDYLTYQDYATCDYTLGSIFMWCDYFSCEYCISNDMLVLKSTDALDGHIYFSLPFGPGKLENILPELKSFSIKNYGYFSLNVVPEKYVAPVTAILGASAEQSRIADWFDYVYNAADLSTLVGKKYNGQRNHINKFLRLYPDFQYLPLDKANLPMAEEFMRDAYKGDQNALADYENNAVFKTLRHFEELHLDGAMLKADGRIAALTVGEKVRDTLYVHIEKADRAFEGAYTMINREFAARNTPPEISFINREEDVGDEGLRRAKQSYHPCTLMYKYRINIS